MNAEVRNYRKKVKVISDGLDSEDTKLLKYLCKDIIPEARLAEIKNGLDLMSELEDQELLSSRKFEFLAELLCVMGRFDLSKQLGFERTVYNKYVTEKGHQLDRFRLMMFKISEETGKDDLDKFKHFGKSYISKGVLERCEDVIDLFELLEQRDVINKKNITFLDDILIHLSGPIHELVYDYRSQCRHDPIVQHSPPTQQMELSLSEDWQGIDDRSIDLSVHGSRQSPQIEEPYGTETQIGIDFTSGRSQPPQTRNVQTGNDSPPQPLRLEQDPAYTEWDKPSTKGSVYPDSHPDVPMIVAGMAPDNETHIDRDEGAQKISYEGIHPDMPQYNMNADPRGICIIINNSKFEEDCVVDGAPLKERIGSELDFEHMTETFSWLKFNIVSFKNLRGREISHQLRKISLWDHSRYDCLVVCVMSHGNHNNVFGTDGVAVPIVDMTTNFKPLNCNSLTGKPKLFFFQACQGRHRQNGHDYEHDAPSLQRNNSHHSLATIPNEADFLIGHSTVPGYVSYRSKSQGSWYITKLTEVLRENAKRYDLMSMLVMVNHAVGDAIVSIGDSLYKQTPAPMVTLRKQLYFFGQPSR